MLVKNGADANAEGGRYDSALQTPFSRNHWTELEHARETAKESRATKSRGKKSGAEL